MKNEAPYIREWVAFHRLIGFDRIEIYENDSSDDTAAILKELNEAEWIARYVPWTNADGSPQLGAYTDAIRNCRTDWLCFLDADEFLNIHSRKPVNAFLEQFAADVSCVAVNWRIFGSNGLAEFEPNPVIERFTRASTVAAAENRHVKCFVRPKQVEAAHIHAPFMRAGRSVMANGSPLQMEPRGVGKFVMFEPAQINHYFTKSRGEYIVKRHRGNANRNNADPAKFTRYTEEMFTAHDLNDQIDDTILWAANSLRETLENIA
jgi:glycosyltransferase involved in cell wall biosynthesis